MQRWRCNPLPRSHTHMPLAPLLCQPASQRSTARSAALEAASGACLAVHPSCVPWALKDGYWAPPRVSRGTDLALLWVRRGELGVCLELGSRIACTGGWSSAGKPARTELLESGGLGNRREWWSLL